MKSISLYQDKNTIVHKIDSINKILYIIAAISMPFILSSRITAMIFVLISLISLILGKVLKKTIPIVGFSMIVILTVIIIQGLFRAGNKTPVISLGKIVLYKEGLLYALGIGLNVINILLSFSILVLTTRPSDLIESLVKIGLSPKIGYVLSSVFQIIPQMTATMETITDAQRSRGLETEGKLSVRIKAFIPLISPVVMNSLIVTKERAIALEVRGFTSKVTKSFLNDQKESNGNKILKYVIIAIFILSIVWRLVA